MGLIILSFGNFYHGVWAGNYEKLNFYVCLHFMHVCDPIFADFKKRDGKGWKGMERDGKDGKDGIKALDSCEKG